MGDKRRFHLFAKLISRNFPPSQYRHVFDVAGGKGHLQLALKELGYKEVVTFDTRRKRAHGLNYRTMLLTPETKGICDLVVAMHPDEATDVAIAVAAKRKIPFVICPCCAKPTLTHFFGPNVGYRQWLAHLRVFAEKNGYRVDETALKMNGKNICLIGRMR